MAYLVIAYYCGPDKTKAVALARSENDDRGGKYGCAVYKFDADGLDYKEIAYFGAMMHNEEHPFHNHMVDFFQTLGHKFARYAEGFANYVVDSDTMHDKDGKPLPVVQEHVEKPPQWVVDEYQRLKKFCDAMIDMDKKREDKHDV